MCHMCRGSNVNNGAHDVAQHNSCANFRRKPDVGTQWISVLKTWRNRQERQDQSRLQEGRQEDNLGEALVDRK